MFTAQDKLLSQEIVLSVVNGVHNMFAQQKSLRSINIVHAYSKSCQIYVGQSKWFAASSYKNVEIGRLMQHNQYPCDWRQKGQNKGLIIPYFGKKKKEKKRKTCDIPFKFELSMFS